MDIVGGPAYGRALIKISSSLDKNINNIAWKLITPNNHRSAKWRCVENSDKFDFFFLSLSSFSIHHTRTHFEDMESLFLHHQKERKKEHDRRTESINIYRKRSRGGGNHVLNHFRVHDTIKSRRNSSSLSLFTYFVSENVCFLFALLSCSSYVRTHAIRSLSTQNEQRASIFATGRCWFSERQTLTDWLTDAA